MNLLITIPALNEQDSIGNVIEDVKENFPEANILVVDDGSTDKTAKIALDSGAKVISLPFNVGVGGAIRVAYKYALSGNFSHVLQLDADGQHLPTEAKQLLNQSIDDSVIIGSRFLNVENNYKVSSARKSAMWILARFTSYICKQRFTDVTSGFRLSSGKAIEIFAREYPRDYLGDTVESLIIAHRSGLTVKEVPVEMRQREFGEPSQNLIKSALYLLRTLLVITLALTKKQTSK